MSKPKLLQDYYDKFVTPDSCNAVEHMTEEECGIIILNKGGEV